jgi:class 3 adenylate cyclase
MGALLDNSPPPPGATAFRNRKLAAILHADVVGFSRLMGEDEAGTHQALGKLRRAVDPLIAAHGGRIVGTAGDSLLADFSSVVDTLSCALEMQRASRAINDPLPPERRLELRIGVNLGDVIVDGTIFSVTGSTSPPDSKHWPSQAPFAFRTPSLSTSETSSISITARSATIA